MNSLQLTKCLKESQFNDESTRLLIALCTIIFSSVSTVLNIILFFSIIKHWDMFKKQRFSYFVISMTISGFFYSTTNLIVSGPCIISSYCYITNDNLMIILTTPNTLSHWGYLITAFSFSLYRFSIFITIRNKNNSKTLALAYVIIPWIITFALTFGTMFTGCYKRFNSYALQYTYNCSDCNMFFGLTTFQSVNFWGGQILPLTMLSLYTIIILRIQQKQQSQANKRELGLTLQYFVICIFQYLASFLFYIIPKVGGGSVISIILMNSIGVFNVAVNPIVLFCFNNQIKHAILNIFVKTKITSLNNLSTHPVTSIPLRNNTVRPTLVARAKINFNE